MASFPNLNSSTPSNHQLNFSGIGRGDGNKSMVKSDSENIKLSLQFQPFKVNNYSFSYDLSELKFRAANLGRGKSLRNKLAAYQLRSKTNASLPFKIIKNNNVKPEPLGKINVSFVFEQPETS